MDRLFTLRLLILIPLSLFYMALQGQYYFDKLTEENGLSDNRVTCFLKDKTGFLWIGTKSGLNRFDGNFFKVFKPNSGNSISNEIINDIVQDSAGKIWVATMAGLNIYDPLTNLWETMMPNGSDSKNDLPNYIIWDLVIDGQNKIWIVSDAWELSVYDPATKKFIYYDWPSFKKQKVFDNSPSYRSIQKIVRKNEREWWLATTIGLCSMDIQSGKFKFYGAGYTSSIKTLNYDSLHNIVFLITEAGQLFCYDEKMNLYEEIKTNVQAYPATVWNKKNNEKDLLLVPHPAGMLEINTALKEATVIVHRTNLSSSLLPGGTNSIYTDDTGMVWIGVNNGVNYYNNRNRIADFIPLTAASDKDGADGMSAVFYDTTDRRYYITSLHSRELFIIDDHTGEISSVNHVDGKSFSACTNICSDRQNNIWLLTETNVYKYDRAKKKFNFFPTPNNGRPVVFHDLVEDKKGNYWLATWQDGVYQYKTKENSFYKLTKKDSISSKNITALMNDPFEDAVWFGTFNLGAYRYDLIKNNIINYCETPANPDYHQLNLIRDIEADASGKLWMTTIGAGLYVYRHGNPYEKSFSHLTIKNGLKQSSYYSIAADIKNRIWLLDAKGLSAIDQAGKFLYQAAKHPVISFTNYATDIRYPKRIFYNKEKNELLVPVAGGLMLYYPDKKISVTGFPIVLTDILIGGVSVMYDSSFWQKKNIEIPFKLNSISFQFAALNYEEHENTQYEYKLHESDAEWKPVSISGAVDFPDLSSGYYKFMVRAKDPGGHLSSNMVSFSFRIKPPFWKTVWFIALIAILVLLGIFFWIRSLQRKLKAEKIFNYFATSLYGQNTVDDIFWDIAKNCISQLKLEDCVIYQYNPVKKILVQKAAYGPKNPEKHEIINAIDIPYGKGIVGTAAAIQKPVIVRNTAKDNRYIVDDRHRRSEIAVPIFVEGKLFGIIDSEHSKKNFYTRRHLRLLQKISAICSYKISKYLVAEKVRTDIARDLHDEMGSTLTSINIISKLALQQAGSDKISSSLQKIKDYSGNMMESMSDIVWAINPMNDSIDRMILRMRELAAELLEPVRINYTFREEGRLNDLKLDVNQRKELYLIFKEAVNNAVKYSGASELIIQLKQEKEGLCLKVNDNGKGFDINNEYSGSGIQNMHGRAEKINARLHIQSAAGTGTAISVSVPLPIT